MNADEQPNNNTGPEQESKQQPHASESCWDKFQDCVSFDRVWVCNSVLQYISAGVIVIASVVRLALIMQIEKFAGIALTLYLLLIAAIFVGTELSLRFKQWFYFLNFGWGKSLAYVFVTGLMLGSGAAVQWLDVLCAVYFLGLAGWMPLVSCVFGREERQLVDNKLEACRQAQMENAKVAAEKEQSDLRQI